ncbi:hypothetical protein MPH_11935 [Macrophomina phaseolina MS6]|uniref:Uncharacterized protein n=1 Tax=Macrophomina phaseolina (strain MS6) TaxID=1126212 RepID=K2RDB2_MACPH|nr:hypothetical protein MPH_11935 [Macrophomina phaseolina MS6]
MEKEGRRTSSPVSPFRDTASTELDSSPVSSLSETSMDSRDALLLPHERTALADTFNVSIHNGKIDSRDEFRDLAKARTSLQKKNKIARRKHGISPKGKVDRHGFDLPAPIHSSDIARAALMETLQKISADKNATTEERNTVAHELPRTVSDVLELSRRSPVKPATPVKSAASDPPPPSPLVPHPLTKVMRTLHNQDQGPVGGERIAHPVKIQYDPPITLMAGILQRGFKRWRCCRCQCFTHYENHVCSKLDCMHRRCEGKCDTFEP